SSLANLSASDVTITRPGTIDLGQPITVAVQSTYTPMTSLIAGLIGVTSLTLHGSATMQIRSIPASSLTCPPPATAPPTGVPPTSTAVPPTATAVPPTATAIPPTATKVPPTATAAPPTATSVPPTATPCTLAPGQCKKL